MRALRMTGWKQPPDFQEVPDPEPGPGEVVITVGGAGLCHSDLMVLHEVDPGGLPYELPFTLGHENAGWVETTGLGVSGLEVGQPVAVYGPWGCGRCYRCQQGAENFCDHQSEGPAGGGLGRDGGLAPRMLVANARYLVPLTDLDPLDAAPLTDAGLTPYHAIKRSLSLLVPGSHVVVIGAGGGLGHLAVQILAALAPSRIIAVDQRESGLTLARRLGADDGVLSGDDTVEEIRALTHGRGAELVLDFVGVDATMGTALSVSRTLGHVTIVGVGGGTVPYSFFSTPFDVLLGNTYWGTIPELVEVVALAERGRIRAQVQRLSLDEAPKGYDALATGAIEGRAVVVPDDRRG